MKHAAALRTAGVALALVFVQFAAIRLAPNSTLVRGALPVTIAGVPVALWPYRRHAAIWIVFVGLLANLTAVLANGGLMPIEQQTVFSAVGEERGATYVPGHWLKGSKDVLIAEGNGHALVLGDTLVVHMGRGGFVASAGDVVVGFGLVILAVEASVAFQRRSLARPPFRDGAGAPAAKRRTGGSVTSS